MVKPSKKAASPQRQPYTPQATPAIKLLMDAWHCAADIGSDPARFPVPIGELQEAGMPGHEIQWAADKRYVEVIVLPCCPYSGLLLTDKGVEYFEPLASGIAPAEPAVKVIDIRPDWNIDLRKLKVGERLVKQFHRPAPVQELVMAALEEDDWIRRIDDPLAPIDGMAPKRRLNRTIESLNENMIEPLIRFFADGTGKGICWEYTDPTFCWPPHDATNIQHG